MGDSQKNTLMMHPMNVNSDGVMKPGPDVASNYVYIGCVWILIKRFPRQDLGSIARARSSAFVDKGEPSTQC